MNNSVLSLKNATKVIGGKKILNNVNIDIKKSEIYGFIGENGAGKTSVIKAIAGLITLDIGDVYFKENRNRKVINTNIRYLWDTPPRLDYLTVESFLKVFINLYDDKRDYSKINEILSNIGLLNYRNKKIKTLSLGMKKKIYLYTLTIKTPEVVILDEPFNGLDVKAIIDFKDMIVDMNQNNSTTFLISSHLLEELNSMCSRIGIIKNGSIIKEEKVSAINENNKISVIIKLKNLKIIENNIIDILKEKIVNKDIKNNSITIEIIKEQCNSIIKELVNNDIEIYEFYIKNNLRDFYLKETVGGKNEVTNSK